MKILASKYEERTIKNTFKEYNGLDGLRAYAILGIVIMHVFENGNFKISNELLSNIIPRFGDFVFLFMVLSGFCMCCGYYEKVKENSISYKQFYDRRYKKIWPYFIMICLIDIIISPSIDSMYEFFANMTLCQGFLPNPKIGVVGVSWTLGVIFVFYIIFPFYCYLIDNRKKSVISITLALIFNIFCEKYFFDLNHVVAGFDYRQSIVYCSVYFLIGGGIYLYREELKQRNKLYNIMINILTICSILLFCLSELNAFGILFVSAMLLITGIRVEKEGILSNGLTKFVSGISFEIYLCHMMIYRVIEKMNLLYISENGVVSWMFSTIFVICGSIIYSVVVKYILKKVIKS